MVINIPSKLIYEMQNEKVIDNDIDKIEVQAKTVVPDNHYDETVYNEELELNETAESYENHSATSFTAPNSGGNATRYGTALTGLYVVAKYNTIPRILIPKQPSANQRIVQVNHDIKYRVSFDAQYYKKSTSYNIKTNVIDYTGGSTTLIEQKQNISSFNDVSVEYEQNASAISNHISSTTAGSLRSLTATNSLKLYPEENYSSVRIKSYLYADSTNWVISNSESHNIQKEIVKDFTIFLGGDVSDDSANYIISNIKVLSSVEAYALSTVEDFGDKPENLNGYGQIGGLYIKTVPKGTIELTVYGNTIGIDLQDNTITIGDGKNVISFQGNELVQTTNSPSIESQYQTVLNEWKEGKETATLRCGIADYYSTDGAKAVSISKENGLPMTFRHGDIVCPYVFGANGRDRPMSINKDGTPKNFEVISKRMIYDGAVWQEIGLQEKVKITAEVHINDKLGEFDGYSHFQMTYFSGKLPVVGDMIIFDGESAEVVDKEVGRRVFQIRAKIGGKYENSVGRTITVEFR